MILDSRINAHKALVKAIKSASKKPSVFIQASAVGYYGNRTDEVLTETSSPGNDFTAQVCMQWEDSTAEVESMNIRRIVVRTNGMVLGKNGGTLPFILLPYRLFIGGSLRKENQWISWIHTDDEIQVIQFLLDQQNALSVYNCSSPQPIRSKEFS